MLTSYRYYTVSFKKIKHNHSWRRIIWRKEVMHLLVYPIGTTKSCRYAAQALARDGIALTDHPCPEVTHLLLDVPTFDERGMLRDGTDLKEILRMLPLSITVIGGKLHPEYLSHYRKIDLLNYPVYLAKNAAITGVSFEKDRLGVMSYERESGKFESYFTQRQPKNFHGTGDIYTAAAVGAVVNGMELPEALKLACDYTAECIRLTIADPQHRFYGVNFEQEIPTLLELMK
jgi:hypothetical protein